MNLIEERFFDKHKKIDILSKISIVEQLSKIEYSNDIDSLTVTHRDKVCKFIYSHSAEYYSYYSMIDELGSHYNMFLEIRKIEERVVPRYTHFYNYCGQFEYCEDYEGRVYFHYLNLLATPHVARTTIERRG